MHDTLETGPQGELALAQLAAEIDGAGFAVRVAKPPGRRPYLHVRNRNAQQLTENIYAGPSADKSWWFWWGWAERIAPVADAGAAAGKIEHVLAALGAG